MKRGIIRIIAGIVMIILQILAIKGQSSVENLYYTNMWYNIGFYSVGITGAILLFFGTRACSDGRYSQLILHSKTKTIHTIIKWVGFVLSTLLFIHYLRVFITWWPNFNIVTILYILGFLSFSVYSLFYMYKKPSCLFSATLIFFGVAYAYGVISNLTYYILYLSYNDHFVLYVFTNILPSFAAGILYIVIASIIHKENFSANTIKVLGWTVFALEILNRVVHRIIVMPVFYFADVLDFTELLFVIVLMLYMSVFKVNTLRGALNCEVVYQRSEEPSAELSQTTDKILFCRKCGEELIDNSRFCRKCGTEIVD